MMISVGGRSADKRLPIGGGKSTFCTLCKFVVESLFYAVFVAIDGVFTFQHHPWHSGCLVPPERRIGWLLPDDVCSSVVKEVSRTFEQPSKKGLQVRFPIGVVAPTSAFFGSARFPPFGPSLSRLLLPFLPSAALLRSAESRRHPHGVTRACF